MIAQTRQPDLKEVQRVSKMNRRPTIWHDGNEIDHSDSAVWGTLLREVVEKKLLET